ncbi:glycosyl transferases group 1 family protein [Orientia chuto str. Dubai]|uniref:Glycosyl transferases group 1 family protein n=1 Tax=Orientia chuto str. Dubai TaxID=1359168 RepID=A0A0F3MMT3_9RICK|nr:glycosyltransferase family 4 protein [Candidatus Orientia mediorientalis]KJV56772.1 glycosyl transferases group 1 family protein [Orientia chuto str. Dubai]
MSITYHKKTILQVTPSLVNIGVERGTIDVANYLVQNGYKSLVASSGGVLLEQLNNTGSTHYLVNTKSKNPFIIWRNHAVLSDIIKQQKVDIIHARSRAPAFSSYLAARKTKIKFITTFHGFYNFSTLIRRMYNSIMVKGDIVIVVSNFVKNHIIRHYNVSEEKIRVIHRGIDLDYFNPENIEQSKLEQCRAMYNIPTDVCVILLPAKMTKWKGHEVVIEALNIIKDCNFYCIMVGDTLSNRNFTNAIRKKIMHYKLQSKIQIFGSMVYPPELYALADIVLCPSIEPEAFSRVVVEAQAMEKVVIASNIGSTMETIANEATGFYTNTDDAHDLSEKIKYALLNLTSNKMQIMRKQARKFALQQFSLQQMQSKILSAYNEL